jgi:hypothetical protein
MLDFTTSTAADFSTFGRSLWVNLRALDSQEAISQQICERLFREFIDADGNPTVALVRVFRLTDVADLPLEVQREVGRNEHKVMALMGTYGIEKEWCSRTGSATHQAIPLSAIAVPQQIPMFQEVLAQMGVDLEQFYVTNELPIAATYKGAFHIGKVPGNPAIPAQDQFVRPYGIQSLVGFGGFIGQGTTLSLFLLYIFSLVPVSAQAAANIHSMEEFVGTAIARGQRIFSPS